MGYLPGRGHHGFAWSCSESAGFAGGRRLTCPSSLPSGVRVFSKVGVLILLNSGCSRLRRRTKGLLASRRDPVLFFFLVFFEKKKKKGRNYFCGKKEKFQQRNLIKGDGYCHWTSFNRRHRGQRAPPGSRCSPTWVDGSLGAEGNTRPGNGLWRE